MTLLPIPPQQTLWDTDIDMDIDREYGQGGHRHGHVHFATMQEVTILFSILTGNVQNKHGMSGLQYLDIFSLYCRHHVTLHIWTLLYTFSHILCIKLKLGECTNTVG
jgi:hypothetical protein